MKKTLLTLIVLFVIGFLSCSLPSGNYDIAEGVVEHNLDGHWNGMLVIENIVRYEPDNGDVSQRSTIPIDLRPAGCGGQPTRGKYIATDESFNRILDDMMEFMSVLKSNSIGFNLELQAQKKTDHYNAAMGIADFENDILAHVTNGTMTDLFELYHLSDPESKKITIAGLLDDNNLSLSMDEELLQLISTGELTVNENGVYTLNGTFSWDTDYFIIEGAWVATKQ